MCRPSEACSCRRSTSDSARPARHRQRFPLASDAQIAGNQRHRPITESGRRISRKPGHTEGILTMTRLLYRALLGCALTTVSAAALAAEPTPSIYGFSPGAVGAELALEKSFDQALH